MAKLMFNPITGLFDLVGMTAAEKAAYVEIAGDTMSGNLTLPVMIATGTGTSQFNGAVEFNEVLKCLHEFVFPVLASAPTSPTEGSWYINSGDNKVYVYYGGTWQDLHALTPAAANYLLLESGDSLLLESGDKLIL